MRAKFKPPIKVSGQSILVKNDRMKEFYAPHHYHSDYEVIYIKKSFGIRIIGNNIHNYQAGEVVVLGPGLPHFHVVGDMNEADDDAYIETIAVLFPESIFDSNAQFPEFAQVHVFLEHLKYGIELKAHTKTQVQQILEQMTVAPSLTNFIALFKIFEIISDKNSSYKRLSTVKYDNKKIYNQKTKHILAYVANNYQENIKISDVAQQAGLSKTGFCNFFIAQTGYTFSHYLNLLRVSKACELLATTKKSVSEIAFEAGYENLAYFNRKFKEIKEETPKNFRRGILL